MNLVAFATPHKCIIVASLFYTSKLQLSPAAGLFFPFLYGDNIIKPATKGNFL
jgi:hypothetical protein